LRIQAVDFIQHQQPPDLFQSESLEDLVHGLHLFFHARAACVHNMEQEIRIMEFL
jgi:hypothetical protein